jgi:glycosyltransferase involved in cell wall biosynthesis
MFGPSARHFIRKLRTFQQRLEFRQSLPSIQAEIQNILKANSGLTPILFAPGLSWDKQLFQRPQQLAIALAKAGMLVFYLEPQPAPSAQPLRPLADRLFWCHTPAFAFQSLPSPLVYLLTWSLKPEGLQAPQWVYDFVDDLDVFQGDRAELEKNHRERSQQARLVLASARRLHEQVQTLRGDALYCPNGVDYDRFTLPPGEAPADLAALKTSGQALIGYTGALAHWVDFSLVKEAALLRPQYSFLFLGPSHDDSLAASGALDLPNIHWLDARPYALMPACLHAFDAAMIPFKLNPLTHATSPLKLFEYLACGKPTVVTPMEETLRYDTVLPAATPQEFAARLDEALSLKNDPSYLSRMDAVAHANRWEVRAAQILEALR